MRSQFQAMLGKGEQHELFLGVTFWKTSRGAAKSVCSEKFMLGIPMFFKRCFRLFPSRGGQVLR